MLTLSPTRRPSIAIPFSVVLVAVAASATAVGASSDDAWAEFQAEVEETCRTVADGVLENPEIVVDPFGSESYGMAVLTGLETGGDGTPRMLVCVFDKASRSAEIGMALDLPGASADR